MLDDSAYGTHTMRRTKASLMYRRTKPACGADTTGTHETREYRAPSLGIEVDDALEMAKQTEV